MAAATAIIQAGTYIKHIKNGNWKANLESWGKGVPALNNVGDACVNQRSDNKLYVYIDKKSNSKKHNAI